MPYETLTGSGKSRFSLLTGAGKRLGMLATCVAFAAACQPGQESYTPVFDQHRSWVHYGGGPDQSKFVDLDEIDKTNVNQLEVAWYYPTEENAVYQFNPIVANGVMYLLAKGNSIVALDAETGEELWIHAELRGIARRGLTYWESEDGEDRRILFQMNNYLQAIDARTGESILDFGNNGLVDLKDGFEHRPPETIARIQTGMPGTLYDDILILGSATGEGYVSTPGDVRAYNVVTGERLWSFRTIPHPGEYGYDTWPEEAYLYMGGVNVWGEISVDEERAIAYLPLGSPTYDFYGADRIGANLFGSSLVAVDARTGDYLWHFQAVHHDLWDYDLSSAPQLITINREGREIDAVAVATKQGFLFVFDRETGEPVYEIEERPVPASDVPGEEAWPTQPHPVDLPPFARQTFTSDMVSPYLMTDEERAEWIEIIDELNELGRVGPFVPMSVEHQTLSMPGVIGGSNWGSTAANPREGMVYVINTEWPSLLDPLERREPDPVVEEEGSQDAPAGPFGAVARGNLLYEQQCQACHGASLEGAGQVPSLIGMERRMNFADFRQITLGGVGEMPAFSFNADELMDLYRYLGGSADGDVVEPPEGPVVAFGGAPGGQSQRPGPPRSGPYGTPYPEGVDAPEIRYFNTGWGLGVPYIIEPPWSTIVAYDLNEGVIKWERPLGSDLHVEAEGGEESGIMRTQRFGMIVTSSGLVFSTAGDKKVYAFDADTGEELWSADLPTGSEGLPSLYEVNGRHYLAVTATTPVQFGRDDQPEDPPQGGYVIFALPE